MAFIIFLWRHSIFFFESAEEMIVSAESRHFVNFGDRDSFDDIFLAHAKPVFGDVAVKCLTGLLFKFATNMGTAYKEDLFQPFKCKFFRQMVMDIGKKII